MLNKYAKYAAAKTVRVRIRPVVVIDNMQVTYTNLIREKNLNANWRESLPPSIKPFPKLEKAITVIITGKLIKTVKGGLVFMAESLATLKGRKPYPDVTAQQLLWDRKFFTPLFFQQFLKWSGEVTPKYACVEILKVKTFLQGMIKGKILLKTYRTLT